MSNRNREGGFALLEVLIAFAIAALALGLLFQAAGSGGNAARTAGYYEEAVSRAKSRMAMLGRATPLAEGESQGEDGGPYRWRIKVTPSATAEPARDAPPTTRRATLYDIDVAISWTVDRRKHEIVLRSQRLGVRSGAVDG
ncbi:MAG: pseudopilin [Rhodospirillales bacterium]|nr:pseudopilin [Rhodospirillales bacterium]